MQLFKKCTRCNSNNTLNGCAQEPMINTLNGCAQEPMMQSNFLAAGFGHVHLASSTAHVLPSYHKQYFDIGDLHMLKPRSSHIVPVHFESLQYLQQWNSMYGSMRKPIQYEVGFFPQKHPGLSPGPTHPFPYWDCYKTCFSGVKHLWHEADHSPPRTALQKDGTTLPIPHTPMPSWFKCLITHINSFTCESCEKFKTISSINTAQHPVIHTFNNMAVWEPQIIFCPGHFCYTLMWTSLTSAIILDCTWWFSPDSSSVINMWGFKTGT